MDFARLMVESAPELFRVLFGSGLYNKLETLYRLKRNLFSYELVRVAETNGKVAGMLLGYGYRTKHRQDPRTGWLMFRYNGGRLFRLLPGFLALNRAIGRLEPDEFYISNVAVYPAYRGKGLGRRLLEDAGEQARKSGIPKLVLDVETHNHRAKKLYENLGFSVIRETHARAGGRDFRFYRMVKIL